MIVYLQVKISAVRLAKEIVADKSSDGAGYWFENSGLEQDKLTDREKNEITRQLEIQVERVQKFLNMKEIDYESAVDAAYGNGFSE